MGCGDHGVTGLRRAFSEAGRDPAELIVRGHIAAVWGEDGRIDLDRSFEAAGPLLDAGANQVAFQIPVGYGAMFDTMADVGRFMAEIGKFVQRF